MGNRIFDEALSKKLKNDAINALDSLLESYISKKQLNADKLSYWIKDFCSYLSVEDSFNPQKLKRYKRGEIVKAHLGYNVGSEEGRLHYCIVLDKNNPYSSPVITVIPLTSLKKDKNIKHLKPGEVFLEGELHKKVSDKLFAARLEHAEIITQIKDYVSNFTINNIVELNNEKYTELNDKFHQISKSIISLENELEKMKLGSIALVNQITTISKMRIYDPKTTRDMLSGIRLSDETLDKIDATVKSMFIYK